MNKFKNPLFLIILCITFAFTACSNTIDEGIDDEDVYATVNGKAILQKDYDNALAHYKNDIETQFGEGAWETEAARGLTYREIYEDYVIDEMTNSLLLLDAAEKEGITVTEEEKQFALENFKIYFENDEEYKSFLEQSNMTEDFILQEMAKEILVNNYITSKFDNINPTDDEMKTFFDDIRFNVTIKASHILVDTEEEAIKIFERITEGENFEELAKELSTDIGTGENGGDLDYFKYTQMVQPFSEAAFALEIGEVSQPVQSEYGYHIIKLTDKIVEEEKTAETEKDQLIDYYKAYKFQDHMEQLKSNAVIEIK